MKVESFGRFLNYEHKVHAQHWPHEPLKLDEGRSILPYGMGRSYGDSCLNGGESLVTTRSLDRFIDFSTETGRLQCEAGVSLAEILEVVVPKGWFLPVSPGTKLVTVGGAIANDVHGKNHHRAGSFGRFVNAFELLRSNGDRLICSPVSNVELYRATIGGLGLTGLITWAEIQLKPIESSYIDQESIRYHTLGEFFELSKSSETDFEYCVSWIDCFAKGDELGRGLFMRGNHAKAAGHPKPLFVPHGAKLSVPINMPYWVLSKPTLKAFNMLYYRKQLSDVKKSTISYEPFFYPLDGIRDWNRLYGRRGLLQYQCVIPEQNQEPAIREILKEISAAGIGSFLAVLKTFGLMPPAGLLSFARPGSTLALDFPNVGTKLFKLLDRLDEITVAAGGAIYPAKDARMSQKTFRASFPNWQEFSQYIDPRFSSSFWRRINE